LFRLEELGCLSQCND